MPSEEEVEALETVAAWVDRCEQFLAALRGVALPPELAKEANALRAALDDAAYERKDR